MAKILRNNSSYLVALPPAFIYQLNWKKGTELSITIANDKLILKKRR